VKAFIDRLSDIDSSLGIVATPLYDRAMVMAAELDVKLKSGIDLGPLMCIPFGIKDHHQIFDDEPTMYGSIVHSYNVQKTKSTAANHLMKYGAIPIAKTMLGTFASGSGNSWGTCMSPYLNGPGGGSSCGSGSGAAYGAFPFAVSEETNGSVASPAAANLISGHITSYGLVSRGGAGLLTHEQDHLGFHSRYLSDFGVILNYFRTGKDPLDGDSLDVKYVNPAKVDVTKLRVMIVAGEGRYTTNVSSSYTGKIQAYGKSGWHWPERVEKMKARLLAAGVTVDVIPSDAVANKLWSFNRTTPYHSCANPASLSSNGAEARFQQFEFAMMNSKRKSGGKGNMPVKSYRYLKKCMVEIGKKFLNDPIWSKYDVIIDTPYDRGGGYDSPASGFEMWVRTSKTFVMDYYEALPCATPQGDTVEGAYATLTALPKAKGYQEWVI
jgi:Asp-tRNA(Asn)/Glu-tRNA(Gln) amidotransferase A subunit family amidase